MWILYLLFFLVGIIMGSFYNVVVYRVPLGISIAKGRSICPSCNNSLGFFDLFPLFSWIFLGGKCRYCKKTIPWRYPLIELITGIMFVFTYMYYGLNWNLLIYIPFYSMLLITIIIDYEHMVISLGVLFICSVFSLAGMLLQGTDLVDKFLGALVGGIIYFIIYIVAKFIFKKEAFGEGDVYLLAAIGLVLGVKATIFTAILSFYVALIFVVIFKIFGSKIKFKQEIAFGPYICLTAFIMSIFSNEIYAIYNSLF